MAERGLARLSRLADKYIATLNGSDWDEYYTTERELGEQFVSGFLSFLQKHEAKLERRRKTAKIPARERGDSVR